MSFFISNAYAQAAQQAPPGWETLLFPLGILAFFYFMFMRPQAKLKKERKKMFEELSKGTEVITNGGILGKIIDLDENFIQLEVSENLIIQVQRHAIANMMPKGTYKVQNKRIKK